MIARLRPPQQGEASLRVDYVDGASAVTHARAHNPSRWLIPTARGRAAWACLASFGGGIVSGDRISVSIELGEHACIWLGTQASTKVYKAADATARATQEFTVSIGSNALLVALPDYTTCFADARFHQRQTVSLADTGSIAWLEWYSSGRRANRERWAFAELASHTVIERAGQRLLTDGLLLNDVGLGTVAERMGEWDAIASVTLLGPQLHELAQQLLHTPPRDEHCLHSISPLADGCSWRLAARSPEAIERSMQRCLAPLVPVLGADPWRRRF